MDEQTWLTSRNPAKMLDFVSGRRLASDRKLCLFAVASWNLARPEDVEPDDLAEQYLWIDNPDIEPTYLNFLYTTSPLYAALSFVRPGNDPARAGMLRDVVGNLFQPVRGPNCFCLGAVSDIGCNEECEANQTRWQQWLTWHDRTVPLLAQDIYDKGDWGNVGILADALEDADCDNADILGHLRSECEPGMGRCDYHPHVRGCWCVDLLLGKE